MFFAYSFLLLSSFSFLGFVVDVKLDLRHITISGSLVLTMDHRHLLFWQELSEPLKCLRQIALPTLRVSFVTLWTFAIPNRSMLFSSIHSLAVVLLFACFHSLAFVFSVLSRYCYKLLLFSIGMSALRFCVRLYFIVCNWIGACTLYLK